jgi:hypothetical protein
MVQPIDTWSEMLKVVKQLKTDEAKEKYKNIIIDTVDIAYDAVESHVCSLHGVDAIGDIGFGKGYAQASKEFDRTIREIGKLGYGVVLISHSEDKMITDETGREFYKIQPTLAKRPRQIVNRFVDIIGYARIVQVPDLGEKTYLYLRATIRYEAGSRFKFTPPYIEFTYDNLVKAIADAIDKQEEEEAGSVVDTKQIAAQAQLKSWEEIVKDFKQITGKLIEESPDNKQIITRKIEEYIGKGRKVSELDPDNSAVVELINEELSQMLKA